MDEILKGLCQCGCGKPTKIARQTSKRDGYAKGEPLRYLSGHSKNRLGTGAKVEAPNASGTCLCGCGHPTPLAVKTDASRGVVRGEPISYLQGHARKGKGKRVPGETHLDLSSGYVWVFLPDHREANLGGYVREHRIVAEKMLGRPLTSADHVHHRREPKSDNRPENLLVTTNSEHIKLHHAEEAPYRPWAGYLGYTLCLCCKSGERKHYSRGYCDPCYQRLRRRGELPNLPEGSRTKQPRDGSRARSEGVT